MTNLEKTFNKTLKISPCYTLNRLMTIFVGMTQKELQQFYKNYVFEYHNINLTTNHSTEEINLSDMTEKLKNNALHTSYLKNLPILKPTYIPRFTFPTHL